jgi:hypothetical protein
MNALLYKMGQRARPLLSSFKQNQSRLLTTARYFSN